MEIAKADRKKMEFEVPDVRLMSGEQMIGKLSLYAERQQAGLGLQTLTDYVGGLSYLLARSDLNSEPGLDYIVTSNWPFDLVRRLGADFLGEMTRQTELDRCMAALQPAFALLPDDVELAPGVSRQYCSITFSAGASRYMLMILCPENVILSQQKLREIAVLAGYFTSLVFNGITHVERDLDLTERELECLFWIAEGKTSDEIATILGISRNTINNYITSVMRKTATKTRSEAIAFAVRHNLV